MRRLLLAVLLLGCGGQVAKTPARAPPELVGVWYRVAKGDTLGGIAATHGVPAADLVELNGIDDPDRLAAGRWLFLYGVEALVRRLPSPPRSALAAGRKSPRFLWPLHGGVLTSGFGPRGGRNHYGIDIAVPAGTTVKAAAAGTVVYSDNKQRGYGNLVILRHAGGWATVYAHNRRNLVDEDDEVRQGSPIAEVGSTGRSSGPHLHFEIRREAKAVDPLDHLPAR